MNLKHLKYFYYHERRQQPGRNYPFIKSSVEKNLPCCYINMIVDMGNWVAIRYGILIDTSIIYTSLHLSFWQAPNLRHMGLWMPQCILSLPIWSILPPILTKEHKVNFKVVHKMVWTPSSLFTCLIWTSQNSNLTRSSWSIGVTSSTVDLTDHDWTTIIPVTVVTLTCGVVSPCCQSCSTPVLPKLLHTVSQHLQEKYNGCFNAHCLRS